MDLKKGKDKLRVKEFQEKYNLNYTNTKLLTVGKGNSKQVTGIKIWVCNSEDFKI